MRLQEVHLLYHGTSEKFETYDLNKAKHGKDFGKGFYLTSNFLQAQSWAQSKNKNNAYIYEYSIQQESLNGCKVFELLEYNKLWLDFITNNRVKGKDFDYDIVYDRMADNSHFLLTKLLEKYANNKVSCEHVINKIKRKNDKSDQYCFKTVKAVQLLKSTNIYIQYKDENGLWKNQTE